MLEGPILVKVNGRLEDLRGLMKARLQSICRDNGIKGYSMMNREQLYRAIVDKLGRL